MTDYDDYVDGLLAPYAMLNSEHGGRLFGDEPHPYRTPYGRDRDRIVHCKAFRRLGYKTQVFINSEGDNYRTRLTHTLEVAQISRSVCQALQLNPEFAEVLALGHDLGHTPFGHAGQDALNEVMLPHGGFEHNQQSLRIVHALETRYLNYRGLNLTRASLKGLMKKARVYEIDTELHAIRDERQNEQLCLEASIVDLCDRIAYTFHDLEDGIDADILDPDSLHELDAWSLEWKRLERNEPEFNGARRSVQVRAVLRHLMNRAIEDLLQATRAAIARIQPKSIHDIQTLKRQDYPVGFSSEMQASLGAMQKLLHRSLYRFPKVMQMSRRGARMIQFLFGEFAAQPASMPEHVQARIQVDGLERVISDYISGMTDRYARKVHGYLNGYRED